MYCGLCFRERNCKTMMKDIDCMKLSRFCATWRKNVLNMSLSDMADKLEVTVSRLSAFETGRSTKLNNLFFYYACTGSDKMKQLFINTIFIAIYEMDKDVAIKSTRDINGNILDVEIVIIP